MPFVYETTIRFSQVDPAQVVYFARVYELAHEAFEEIMAAAGMPVGPLFEESEWGMPLVHTEADYRRPWRLGERVRIEGQVAEMTEKTVEFEYAFVDEDGKVRTRVRMRHAFVSLVNFQSRSAPPEFIAAIRSAEEGA
jgi:1,4-dihydroxy-2-naphthoyl-CoA hydrolase